MEPGLDLVVVATQLCAPVPGGTGRYVSALLAALAATAPTGTTVRGALPRGCLSTVQLPVAAVPLALPTRVLARLWEWGMPPRLTAGRVVHAPTLMVPPLPTGRGLVVTVHDLVPWTHPETLTAHGARYHRRVGARAARDADLIVTPKEAVAGQVRRVLRPGCPVVPVHPGASVCPVPGDAAARRQRFGVGSDPYLLFVGTAEPRKALDVLISALAARDLEEYHLVVVGPPGWGRVSIPDLASAAGVASRVHVTGKVSEEDLAALYAGAGAVAMPSRAEGFGFPVAEAMAYGIPVVTSDDAALVEVGGGAAVAVPVGDDDALAQALADVSADGPERRRRVDAGLERARAFRWASTAATMWELYSSVNSGDAVRG